MRRIHRILGPVLLLAALVGTQTLAARTLPDLRDIQGETRRLVQLTEELHDAADRTAGRVAALEDRLAQEERAASRPAVDAEELHRARLDLESMGSRLAVVEGRIQQYALGLARLRTRIEALRGAGDGGLTAEDLRREAGLRLLREQEAATLEALAGFEALAAAGRRNLDLLAQRLRLLQSRLSISAVDRAAAAAEDERIPVLQAVISDFMLRAARANRALEAVVGDTPSAQDRRRALEGRVNDAVTRGFLRQNDLELVLAGNRLDTLAALRADATMPLHVLRAGSRKLDDIEETLDRIEGGLNTQAHGLETRRAALTRQGPGAQEQLAAVADLTGLMDFQRQDIGTLRERLAAERVAFARVIGETGTATLLEHRPLPSAASDWMRLAAAARDLPAMAQHAIAELWQALRTGAAAAEPGRLALLAIALPLLGLLTPLGTRRLRIFARRDSEPGALKPAADAAARALPAALPAVAWGLAGTVLGLRLELVLPVLVLLALWPTAAFLLRLSRGVLGAPATARGELMDRGDVGDARTGEAVPAAEEAGAEPPAMDVFGPRRLHGHLRLGLAIATGIAAVYALTRLLPLPPLLADLLDRLGMLAVLGLLPPALGVARALRERVRSAPESVSRGLRFLSTLSRLLPGFVLVTGIAGVLGYTNLAWTLIGYALWLILIALGLFLGVGLLADLTQRLEHRLERSDPENAGFWCSHFVAPGRRLGQLGLYLAGGWLLLGLWGWDAQTPMVRWVAGLASTELFQLGGAPFTAGDILLTLILVGAALWVGGWSQQVSYRLAYRRIRDLGLRQALATFTQYLVIVVGVLLALSIIGFDLTAVTVFAASLGVGIGFGLQNIVNNFISGILLLAERPLRIGDYVSIGPDQGTVTQIGIRSLTVRTPDRQEVVIPNGSVISKEFTNWTRSDDTVRQVHYFLLRYDSDRERAMELILEVLAANPNVLSDPAPGVFLWEYTDEGVRIRVQFCFRFVHGPGGFATRSEVLLEIGRRFAAEGISFVELGLLRRLAQTQPEPA